ncbi:ATP-binding protein [Desulfococcaceae bacterium HSG9]|nr:ATP-binding protein [Desulfococcaceae bacterium HSG9]
MQTHTSKPASTYAAPRGLLITLVVIFLIVFLIGGYYYHNRKKQIKNEKFDELAAITQSKIKRIVNWRQKIINVADALASNPLIMDELELFINNRGKDNRRRYIDFWLQEQQNKHYKTIHLLDRNGRICSHGSLDKQDEPLPPVINELFANSLHKDKITFSDLYKKPSQEIVLSIFIPLLKDDTVFGAFFAEIDPHNFLFPLIAKWPVPSQTAETLMVRREGDTLVFLNELRHRKNTALTLSLPITRPKGEILPAAYVATGGRDRVEGTDYRGAAVIASVGKIPDTAWFIISKVDKDEIFEHLKTTMAQMLFFTIALIMIVVWVIVVLIHQQRMQFMRNKVLARSLKEVEEAHNRTEGILASIADGLIVTDLKNRIVLMNRVAQKLFKVRLPDVINQSWDTLLSQELLQNGFKAIPKQQQADVIFDFEVTSSDSGAIKTFNARTSVFKNQNGTVSGKITLFRDISQMREAERMKNEFISTTAHEMRTPLTSIQGFSELLMLRKNISDNEKHKYLKYINQKAVNLSEVINDFIDIEHIESGRSFQLKKILCPIDNMIKNIVELFSTSNEKHRFETRFAEQDVQLKIDKTKISQMLKNLIDNAVKYAPDGGPIRITGKKRHEHYEITVEDQGIGMTPEDAAKIFDKFFRADATTTSIEGTGLGMSLAKYIVEAHKGDITVKSKYGEGTRVVVTLPMPQ